LRRCNAALEAEIRRNPTEWIWFHQRWGDLEADVPVPTRTDRPEDEKR
jgi:lauroyl/myristoyl acyltransferase